MQYTYKIDKEDLLEFQLYIASKSEVLIKKRRNSRALLVAASTLFAGYFFTSNEIIMGVYFSIMVVVLILFYYRYFSWKQKLNYGRFIKANYSSRFGMEEELEIFPDKIHVKDNFGEGDVKASELASIVEIGSHFFINLESGSSLVIPKPQVNSVDLKKELKRLKTPFEEELSWSWKTSM
jgi:hypothetical protein